MPADADQKTWVAFDSILKAAAHVAKSSDMAGRDRDERLADARTALEESLEDLEQAIIAAEDESNGDS